MFCQIVEGTADASVVHDDEDLLAFCDLNPVNPGHLLVVPKQHSTGLADLDEADGAKMFTLAHRLAGALRRTALKCEAVNLFLADGEAAGQEVFHVHLHVIPRFAGDPFRVSPGQRRATRAQLDEVATLVRAAV